ncbi:caspase family protein [Streptomyces sp. MK37H]|uniref:HD domain-containing protein n=1 Tax=Streptomyces sp. MK37H TaxID=2699117 RepID=UPI001B385582|nr:caspase family protein [Streptomyces sp. MK37H]MBP8536800.1 hypothetical protein [Streptomyces sp. MK37H]
MITRYKALLIGASDYDEPGITSLPFVRDDLQRLATALTDRGFHSAEIAEHRRGITLNFVKDQVSRFLREAKRHDTLFILLSGHGQHFQGTDYLIPEDASFQVHPFADSCVPLDWSKQLNECAAAQVVFLIDACREGIEQDSMGPAGVEGWSKGKQAAALGRKVAHAYACSPGQFALFVNDKENVQEGTDLGTTPNESFSLFSRALCDVVGSRPHALHLGEFEEAIQERIAQLHAAYRKSKPVQRIRVGTDVDKRDFAVLPGPTREAREHPWVRAVIGHPAWERCVSSDALKDVCVALANRLAESYERAAASLRDDPWHDAELAKRANDRMEFLTSKLPKDVSLSPTESALLALLPFVSQAFWAQEAARRIGALTGHKASRTPESDAFRSFVSRYPRLDRRLRRLRQTGSTDESAHHIRWWLFHRWLLQQPDVYAPQSLKELLGPIVSDPDHPVWPREALSGERLLRFIKDQRTAPFAPPRPGELADHDPIAASTRDEHEVREPLVACLTKAAHALAIDPVDLPEVVAEHLGISDSVDLTKLLGTLRSSQWLGSGAGRALKAVCQHPAVEISLQEHAQRVDSLLRGINQASTKTGHTLAPLITLPPYANAGGVRPSGNAPANLSSGIRFHLAEDRVQELLMGEELYGDPGLAVRELYQNALDACRYRDARTTYLRRTKHRPANWEGLIEFTQGIDSSGRPYLECRDNGIGMGVNELSRAFSQGGARFVDLPEYVEEAAYWAELDPPIELYPNSRFGIGVLSYFMLADEITVHTCRLDRDGRPGQLLKVTIAGPGNLFRIEDEGPGDSAGTRVRLHLTARAAQQSALDQLSSVLWVAQYRTRMVHGARSQEWEPGVLRDDFATDIYNHARSPRNTVGRPFCSSDPDLWWAEDGAVVLADGLCADGRSTHPRAVPGVVVNLHGRYSPKLSVDRRRMRAFDASRVQAIMQTALPSLLQVARSVLTPDWLAEASSFSLSFADEVTERAGEASVTWLIDGHELPVETIGFFPPDFMLLPLLTGEYLPLFNPHFSLLTRLLPSPVLRWRLRALYATGVGGSLGPGSPSERSLFSARPSDLHLLSANCQKSITSWNEATKTNQFFFDYDALSVPNTRQSAIAALAELFPWRPASAHVTAADVFTCVAKTQCPATHVVARLKQLGYRTPSSLSDAVNVTANDVALLHPLGDHFGWMDPGSTLSIPQVSYSAARATCSPSDAAARLRQLGFGVPDYAYRKAPWTSADAKLLRSLWSRDPEPVPTARADEISTARVVSVAFITHRSISDVIQLLTDAGFATSPDAARLDSTHDDDSVLLSDHFPIDRVIPRGQLAAIAQHLDRTVSDVANRLAELGFEAPAPLPASELVTQEDAQLFKRGRRLPSNWPAENRPVDVYSLVSLARRDQVRLPDLAARLMNLGYTIAPDHSALEALNDTEPANLRGATPEGTHELMPIPQERLYAAAQLVRRPIKEVANELTELGLHVQPISDEFAAEIETEQLLADVLNPKISMTIECARTDHRIGPISLPALASVALRYRITFREAAQLASRLGMSHEAEDWFE